MSIQKGDLITYEFLNSNDGRKYVCYVVDIKDDWVIDLHAGTYFSTSFRPQDVIIWEHRRGKKKT